MSVRRLDGPALQCEEGRSAAGTNNLRCPRVAGTFCSDSLGTAVGQAEPSNLIRFGASVWRLIVTHISVLLKRMKWVLELG